MASESGQVKKWSELTPAEKKKTKVGLIVVGAIVFIFIIGLGVASQGNSSDTQKVDSASKTPTSDTSKKSEVPTAKKPAVPAEYSSALYQANTYANDMHMSKGELYDQLTSQYGGQFTAAAAQYAVDNVKADWNANALAQAKTFQNDMHLSPAEIHDQLTSDAGEKFTQAQADYAIKHLDD